MSDKKILVVDDDHELRATITEVLRHEGYRIMEAGSGDDALALLQDAAPALVLLDMVMPGMDGLTAIPLLRQKAPGVRIVVMTAYASVQNAVQSLKQGADDYIVKPFAINDLLMLVKKHLEESRLQSVSPDLDLDAIFHGVANLLRRRILFILHQEHQCRFMDLVRKLGVSDHTKVNFHLKVLREAGFLEQDADKRYRLTDTGRRTAASLSSMVDELTR